MEILRILIFSIFLLNSSFVKGETNEEKCLRFLREEECKANGNGCCFNKITINEVNSILNH